jgi:hypothetical protein
VWEVGFQLVADAGQVRVDGTRRDEGGLICDIEAQEVRGGVRCKVVDFAEGQEGVQGGGVGEDG